MPSNLNKEATGRVTSIRRRLAAQRTRKKIGIYFSQSIFLIFVIFITWYLAKECTLCGNIDWNSRAHYFTCDGLYDGASFGEVAEALLNTKYIVREIIDEKPIGAIYIEDFISIPLFYIVSLSTGLFAINFFGALCAHPSESGKIRRILNPLNEIAIKAEELSKLNLSEDKYRLIEDTITSMEPDEDKKLSFGDEDLLGIEGAMNNLLNRIRESNRQQARFVNDASHELRTPIAVIEGYANMLARWGREDEKVLDESITAISNESAHMKRLVEQLLFLARGDAGRTMLNPTEVDLCETMKEVYEESLMIDENHIYRFNKTDESIKVMVDEGLIKQAVRILVDNAAKYTKDKDEIILSVGRLSDRNVVDMASPGSSNASAASASFDGVGRTNTSDAGVSFNGAGSSNASAAGVSFDGAGRTTLYAVNTEDVGRVCLQVQDTGIGMKEADVEHMFERFYRADDARSFGGTGLGLSIAKWIIDKHEGHFEITSRPDLGTRIRIVL